MGEILRGYLVPHPPLLVPEVGGPTRERVTKTIKAMERMAEEVAELHPDTIIVTTPHGQSFRDFFYLPDDEVLEGDFRSFGVDSPSFSFRHNIDLMSALSEVCEKERFFAGFLDPQEKKHFSIEGRLDHGALVPLYFVHKKMEDIQILYLPTPYQEISQMMRFGEILGQAVRESAERVVFIASGDLSHCLNESAPAGYNPEGRRYDNKLYNLVERMDEEELLGITTDEMYQAAECGTRSFATLWGAMHDRKLISEIYSYEGTFGVGYLVAAIRPEKEEEVNKEKEAILRLARETVEAYVEGRRVLEIPDWLPESLTRRRAAVFVSLKKDHLLRGCIGTLAPTRPSVAQEIIAMAVEACSKDPRFPKVEPDELKNLTYSVDLLSEPEPVKRMDELDSERYGIIVSKGWRRGVLLPRLEGVDNVQQQVDIALKKAGIEADESFSLERFEVSRCSLKEDD